MIARVKSSVRISRTVYIKRMTLAMMVLYYNRQKSWSIHEYRNGPIPYKTPVPNIALRIILLRVGRCNCIITATGRNSIVTSDRTFNTEVAIRDVDTETQWPGTDEFQIFSRGTQLKMKLNIRPVYVGTLSHRMISCSQNSAPFLPTTKMRFIWRSMATLAPRIAGQ